MSYAVVTGGAGFIGSHLARRLIKDGYEVKVLDNFSAGKPKNLKQCDKDKLTVKKLDLRNLPETIKELGETEVVFHLAADPEVRTSISNPSSHYENNVQATFNVLEAMRVNKIKYLVFISSSVVYGDAEIMPTPEDYRLEPISIYGVTKLMCEELIQGYVKSFGIKALMLRPANIIGSNGTHGVILDFINKLKANPSKLQILGDGTQFKSYLHVSDCVAAILKSYEYLRNNNLEDEVYNVGNLDATSVTEIAKFTAEEMGLKNVHFELTGGVEGGRGWKGDIKTMLLSISKLTNIGWQPSLNSNEAVRLSCHELFARDTNR
jgi:UDP-glucose 4-epimerase